LGAYCGLAVIQELPKERPGSESRSLPVEIDRWGDAALKRQTKDCVIDASGTRIEVIACI
jgi:hypothetical protein